MRKPVVFLALLISAACGGDLAESDEPWTDADVASEDVSGVAVTFADSPRFSLGGVDVVGPTQFSGVLGIEVASDGSLWVIDGPTQQLRVFSAEGVHRFSLGGRGDGPGEFRGLNFVGSEPDGTIIAADPTLRRVTRYTTSGRLRGTTRWETPTLVRSVGVTGAGSLVAVTQPSWPANALESGGIYSDTIHVLVWAEPDQIADTVARVPGFTSIVTRTGASILPFSRMPATAVGDQLYVSAGPRAVVRVFGSDSLERSISVSRAPTPVASIRANYLAGLSATRSAEQVRQTAQRLEHPGVPEYIGAYSELVLASTGHLWAERITYDPEFDGVWDVFDPGGRLLGQVRPPANLSIRSIDGELVTGVATDDLGVPYVQQWEITW